ncbi:glycosyltransferase family 4 protein [Sphingobacterium kyonggiense]|uniref:Glycosyltransferase family 4 protein n=1 Tax=Sphingobacterium kyonggiense TaxID=714075 RepID=A0ABP7Z0H7_9SPHI
MGKRMLVIGLVWPEPTSSAAGWRIIQIMQLFIQQGFELHFCSAASKSEFSFPLENLGIKEQVIQLNDASFNKYVEELKPDYVLFDRFMIEEQYSWRVKEVCPQAIRILDTEDLHFLRQARQDAYKKNLEFTQEMLYSDLASREIASILRSDLSLIISTYEMNLLTEQFHISPSLLCYLPFQFEAATASKKLGFEERQNFVFIGNFIHEPNWRTVVELKRLWPSIRKRLGKVELHIYGAYPTQKVWDLNKPAEGFMVKGRAEDAKETLGRYRVLLAPIPFGAGLKGKFVDAFSVGTPSVSSQVATEGMMRDEHEWPGFIYDTDEDFLYKVVQLYQDENTWLNAHTQCENKLNSWRKDDQSEVFLKRLQEIAPVLQQNRNRNFIGQILWNNQFASSKYMSLWIEAKQKVL